ncbi:uncharacterized protein LOC131933913 [Physella acuta]|uniref:uncharacterized protein LOC131933913 n=1 Tax=Physella acuta TaxID=109671 RepID=UPI0027DDF453|nr:uncharacterized protein LOC131933913 [Physella acuta]
MVTYLRWFNRKWPILISIILLLGVYLFRYKFEGNPTQNPNAERASFVNPVLQLILEQPGETGLHPGETGLHPDVSIVPSTPPDTDFSHDNCVPMPESPRPGVIICPHPLSGDIAISKWLLTKGELWEKDLIHAMTDALKRDPDLMLLDIGANIGEYTLWAAAMGRQVVSVEMLLENVQRIQMALALSKLGGHVTIVNNALYSDHRVLEITFYKQRFGLTSINVSRVFRQEYVDTNQTIRRVKTICIDDLTPLMLGKPVYIKMDIEKSEQFALVCAHRFFREVDVRIVQMEWHKRLPEESTPILEFMDLHGYACSFNSTVYVHVDPTKIGKNIDVFFMKKSFFKITI